MYTLAFFSTQSFPPYPRGTVLSSKLTGFITTCLLSAECCLCMMLTYICRMQHFLGQRIQQTKLILVDFFKKSSFCLLRKGLSVIKIETNSRSRGPELPLNLSQYIFAPNWE